MKSLIKFGTVVAVASMLVGGAFAQGKKPAAKMAHKKAAAVMCPVCKMPVSMKKTKVNTVAVKVNGKTMYCCSKCTMPASMLAKNTAKKMAKKPMAKKPMGKK